MERFLMRLAGYLPMREIKDGDRPYLNRYYLCTLFGWRFYLHQFVDDDPSEGLHDHPWRKAFSIVLLGKYFEERRTGTKLVKYFNSLNGDTFHRVVLPKTYMFTFSLGEDSPSRPVAVPCWTIFFHAAKDVKEWGFLEKGEGINQTYKPYQYEQEGGKPKEWWKK